MDNRDIVVIGGSAGSVEILLDFVQKLPEDFDASLFVVLHLPATHKSSLDKILTKAGKLKVMFARDEERFEKGVIYLAPPDYHLLIEDGRTLVKKGPKENRFRPSIDALFRSAAYNYGERVIGIILSGMMDDGTSGLWSIKRSGGVALVQNPSEAMHPSMPNSVLQNVDVDKLISVRDLPKILQELMKEPVHTNGMKEPDKKLMKTEVAIAAQDNGFEKNIMKMGELTPFTCPECHGSLISIKEGKYTRFRCHTGHAFSYSALLEELTRSVEDSFWNSLRGMEETIMLLEANGKDLESNGDREAAKEFYKKAQEIREQTYQVRNIIFEHENLSEEKVEEEVSKGKIKN